MDELKYYFVSTYGQKVNAEFANSDELAGYSFDRVLVSGVNADGLIEMVFISNNGRQANLLGFGTEFSVLSSSYSQIDLSIIREYIHWNIKDIYNMAQYLGFATEKGLSNNYRSNGIVFRQINLLDDDFTVFVGSSKNSKRVKFIQLSFIAESAFFRVDIKRSKTEDTLDVDSIKFTGFCYEEYQQVVQNFIRINQVAIIEQVLSMNKDSEIIPTMNTNSVTVEAPIVQEPTISITQPEEVTSIPESVEPEMDKVEEPVVVNENIATVESLNVQSEEIQTPTPVTPYTQYAKPVSSIQEDELL